MRTSGRAAFSSTGQLCISMERMYVDVAVWDQFVPRFVKATRSLRLGHSLDYSRDIGSLISGRQLSTVAAQVDDATGKGATLLAGGTARREAGPYFYEPTVLTDTTPEMTLYAEETFGPVNVNEADAATWGSVDAPMGGWKDSGVGSRHGEHGILKYTETQTVSIQRLLPIAPPSFRPAAYAKAMTAAMRTPQRLPGRK